ncbi:hypothetical protein PF011_g31559 [Phytophthora fragariae]|uniref:Uncharacterized protein n=1 Tax=Phytophthora fragariae TaxID=53985 RepID=A0A6A3GIE0_9STRA|nr:hypothetical protein PF011_g31559 [Phytophthora fragariae]
MNVLASAMIGSLECSALARNRLPPLATQRSYRYMYKYKSVSSIVVD